MDDVSRARVRILAMLGAHAGYFPFTSELASSCGISRGSMAEALALLRNEGVIRQVEVHVRLCGKVINCKAYELVDQQPGPQQKRSTILAHYHSQTVNAAGKDSHPWRNHMLACPICASVRDCYPDWRVAMDNRDEPGQHRPTHGNCLQG